MLNSSAFIINSNIAKKINVILPFSPKGQIILLGFPIIIYFSKQAAWTLSKLKEIFKDLYFRGYILVFLKSDIFTEPFRQLALLVSLQNHVNLNHRIFLTLWRHQLYDRNRDNFRNRSRFFNPNSRSKVSKNPSTYMNLSFNLNFKFLSSQ